MSITIRDCLSLPSLSLGKVIAGAKGLDSIVNTISVLEFDDAMDDLYIPNELIISSMFIAKDDVAEQCRILEHCKISGDVGLVLFYSDVILQGIDQQLIDTANRINLPIILLPEKDMGLTYGDVINDVMEAIIVDRKAGNFFVSNTMEIISQLPASERNISKVLSLASNYCKSSFFLCDEEKNILASSFWPAGNTVDQDIFENYLHSPTLPNPYTAYRLAFTDKSSSALILYSLCKYGKVNQQIISQTVEIIQLFCALWNYNLTPSSKEALIPALFSGDQQLVHRIAKDTMFPIDEINNLVFISFDDYSSDNVIEKIKVDIKISLQNSISNSIVDIFSHSIVIAFGAETSSAMYEIIIGDIKKILLSLQQPTYMTIFNGLSSLLEIKQQHVRYCDAIDIMKKIYPTKNMFSNCHITVVERCQSILASPLKQQKEYYLKLLDPLKSENDEDLLETLGVYLLDAASEVKTAAQQLFIHRNTVMYRINKINALLKIDINQMPFSYDACIAVALYRLR